MNTNWNTLFITTAFIENLYYIGKFKTELHDHLQYFINHIIFWLYKENKHELSCYLKFPFEKKFVRMMI